MINAIKAKIASAIAQQVFPGCVIGMVDARGRRIVLPFGRLTYGSCAPCCHEDTLYDVASITKAIPTSTLALKAIEEGRITLASKLIDWVPEFTNSSREQVTLWHLLTQTLDFGCSLAALKDRSPQEILRVILTREFRSPPGKCFSYCNASSILLGIIVERVFGKQLDEVADTYLFKPLRMERTTFDPRRFRPLEIAPTEDDPWRGGVVCGCVHDESAFRLREIMIPGSAGLFSTVPDLLNFLQMLLNSGEYDHQTILQSATIESIQHNQLSALGESAAIGWELNRRKYMGSFSSGRTVGKTGFTGCVVMCDFAEKRGLVLLTNHHYPYRKPDPSQINGLRSAVADIVFGAIDIR